MSEPGTFIEHWKALDGSLEFRGRIAHIDYISMHLDAADRKLLERLGAPGSTVSEKVMGLAMLFWRAEGNLGESAVAFTRIQRMSDGVL